MKPLDSFRVLDLTIVLAGPFCCHQLAHLGADVIKIEVPGSGDLARQLGADPELNEIGMGASFLAQNAGKRSLTLNLKHPEGREIFFKLVEQADVVVENFRPGVMERLGLGFEKLKEINPCIVYCAISGFGQDGPMKNFPAYDQIIQGLSGVMSVTGNYESGPLRVGFPLADTIGGITAAMGITASLSNPEREAVFIDVSMLESTMATMGWVISNYLTSAVDQMRMGNENFTSAPSGTFQTGDGLLNIAANKQEQFEILCKLLKLEDLLHHPDFKTRELRKTNREILKTKLESELKNDDAKFWSELLNKAGVPAGEVLAVPDALKLDQIQQREFLETFHGVPGIESSLRVVKTGIQLNGKTLTVDRPPPRLGEDTVTILKDCGYEEDEIEKLQAGKII